MKAPTINAKAGYQTTVTQFGGLDRRPRPAEGFFADMSNLSPDEWPLMTVRRPRQYLNAPDGATDWGTNGERVWYVEDGQLTVDGVPTPVRLSGSVKNRRIVSFAAYLLVYPDGVWYNTVDGSHGTMENAHDIVAVQNCLEDGTVFEPYAVEPYTDVVAERPGKREGDVPPENGAMWLAAGGNRETGEPYLLRYSAAADAWIWQEKTYIRVEYGVPEDETSLLRVGDVVTVRGWADAWPFRLNGEHELLRVYTETAAGEEGTTARHFAVMRGIMNNGVNVTLDGFMSFPQPEFDFVTEYNGRVWACRYGDQDGEEVNEIYGSRAGRFNQFFYFGSEDGQATNTASVVFSVGVPGAFTGAAAYQDTVIFFKENRMIRVYGSESSGYALSEVVCPGVQAGSDAASCVVGGALYYKARTGVYRYDGSAPVCVSEPLGQGTVTDCRAAAYRRRYVMAGRKGSEYRLFVFDTDTGLWYEESLERRVDGILSVGDALVLTDLWTQQEGGEDGVEDVRHGTVYGVGSEDELETLPLWMTPPVDAEEVEWFAETGIIGLETPEHKRLKKLLLRLALEPGSELELYARWDSIGEWEMLYAFSGGSLRTFDVPVIMRRCDHLQLRMQGRGGCRVYSMSRIWERGSGHNAD